MELGREHRWVVRESQTETPLVQNLCLESASERPQFVAGQYLTVRLPDLGPAEGKAYSISSAPHESFVRLSIKQIGTFSEALRALRPGDELVTSAPYGFFYPEPGETAPLVFVVGGIGVTPCLSIIKDLLHRGDARSLQLHYSNQTEGEVAFIDELQQLIRTHSTFTMQLYVTREQRSSPGITYSRMSPQSIAVSASADDETEFFICGAMDFTKNVWKGLRDAGVAEHRLYTEGFF